MISVVDKETRDLLRKGGYWGKAAVPFTGAKLTGSPREQYRQLTMRTGRRSFPWELAWKVVVFLLLVKTAFSQQAPARATALPPVYGENKLVPLSVDLTGALRTSGGGGGGGGLTDAQLRASPVPMSLATAPLPNGAATETTLGSILGRLPALVTGRIPIDGSGVTQPVSISGSVPVTGTFWQATQPVSLPAMALSSFSQAGVIAINTDLLVIDLSGAAAVSIQCTSMGTSGVVTPSWSNDNVTFVNASIMTPGGVAAATFNAAGLWNTPVYGRYLRLRLTVAASAGTTALSVQRLATATPLPLVSQPVAVAGTVPVSGTLTSAGTTTATPVTPTTTFTNSAATNNAAFLKASAGTVWSVVAYNSTASPRYVKFYNQTTAPSVGVGTPVMVIAIPALSTVTVQGPTGIRFATGIAIAIVTGAADSDNTATGVGDVKLVTSWT